MRSRNHSYYGKSVSIEYPERESIFLPYIFCTKIVYFSAPHCGLSGFTIFFSHYFINGTIYGKMILKLKCVLISSIALPETFLILSRIQTNIVINIY